MLDVLRGLPEAYRETLALRLVEGLSGVEIAARVGASEGSASMHCWLRRTRSMWTRHAC